MRLKPCLALAAQAALVGVLLFLIRSRVMPLGVRGEWEWARLPRGASPPWGWLALAGLAVVGYACFAALGLSAMAANAPRRSRAAWLVGLLVLAIAAQVMVPIGAADEFDLTKWAYVNYFHSSAGYFEIARSEAMRDPRRFLADYPQWIRGQDSLHIGTHPPGLIALQCILLRVMERIPEFARDLLDSAPPSVREGFRQLEAIDSRPLARSERAALYAMALLTLLACAGTVVPIYLLARAALPATAAWIAAALWPLAPAANLFQPVADTAYPFISTSVLALAAWAAREPGPPRPATFARLLLAVLCGALLAVGMVFTLAFLPVGVIVGLVLFANGMLSWRVRGALLLAAGCGFLALLLGGWAVTGADPFAIGYWNLRNHARFYVEYPRTYRLWLWVNGLELAIALGLPSALWCAIGLVSPRAVPRVVWSTLLVLVVVDFTGRNMGEVARLWLLFMPPLLVAAGLGCARVGGGPRTLAVSAGLLGLQTLALQTMIQVVYPV